MRASSHNYILLLPFPLGSTSLHPSCSAFSHITAFSQFIHFPDKELLTTDFPCDQAWICAGLKFVIFQFCTPVGHDTNWVLLNFTFASGRALYSPSGHGDLSCASVRDFSMIIMIFINISYLFSSRRKGLPLEVKRRPTQYFSLIYFQYVLLSVSRLTFTAVAVS